MAAPGKVAGPRPRLAVVGLGPGGPQWRSEDTLETLARAERAFLRTTRHPAAEGIEAASLDHHYEEASNFDAVYRGIVEELVGAACSLGDDEGYVAYAVPGSPLVAEHTVELLRRDPRVQVEVHPAISFLDLAWARLGVDPVTEGARLLDGTTFAVSAAGSTGPLLVAQCWAPTVLSEIKLALVEEAGAPGPQVTVLQRLGTAGERVFDVAPEDLDRRVEPDHLTSLWIPRLADPLAGAFVALDELGRVLRLECPWDRAQTHRSLRPHVIEEAYEVVDAIDELGEQAPLDAVEHLEEELGDLLFQVVIHARLAAEEGRFTLADVARGVHDKLVRRHPHVFGDVEAATPEAVAANWEVLKAQEKRRGDPTEGIPGDLPALVLAAELLKRARRHGAVTVDASEEELTRVLGRGVPRAAADTEREEAIGEALFALCQAAGHLGVDPEVALRARARRFAADLAAKEGSTDAPGDAH